MRLLILLVIAACVLAIVAAALDVRCGASIDRDLVAVVCRAGRLTTFVGASNE